MMKKLLLSMALVASAQAQAQTQSPRCQLPAKTTLTIGCSTACNASLRTALLSSAKALGYKLNIVTMYNSKLEVDFQAVDGVLVPGGVDIDPKYYKDKVEPELAAKLDQLDHLVDYTKEGKVKDPFEYKLWREYFTAEATKELPALGICRGMQMMAVSQDIPLYIDINEELGIPNRRDLHDTVQIRPQDSRIKSILGWNNFRAYKNHHQGVRIPYFLQHPDRWPHLSLTATSHAGRIAETLEAKDRPALGIQFHPEQDKGQLRSKIFNWLLENSCRFKRKKLSTVAVQNKM